MNTALAIVLGAVLIGGAVVLTRKREAEDGGLCGQLGAIDPKLGTACKGLPILGGLLSGAGTVVSKAFSGGWSMGDKDGKGPVDYCREAAAGNRKALDPLYIMTLGNRDKVEAICRSYGYVVVA